ncbi:MAG: PqqD family protein [Halioglobus sp.]|nr:PqqD family protein [Halioglobus sp.]
MNLNQVITVSPKVISQEVAGETVILDLDSECYFGLDAVGSRVWHLIREGADLATIYHTLLDEYEVDGEQLQADLESLLADASQRGLITLKEAS